MKVLQPLQNNNINFIPRFIPMSNLNVYLKNETTGGKDIYSGLPFSYLDGKVTIELTKQAKEKEVFSIMIEDEFTEEVIYRGKLICTAQETQDFKQSNGVYKYEF